MCGETMTVYADVLVCINLYLDFFLLYLTDRILSLGTGKTRLVISAAVGGLYSLTVFCTGLGNSLRLLLNSAVLVLMVIIAFYPLNLRKFIKCTGTFLILNFLFAGLMLLAELKGGKLLYQNGILYFETDTKLIVISPLSVSLPCAL